LFASLSGALSSNKLTLAAAALLSSSPWRPHSPPSRPSLRASGSACARPASFPRLQAGNSHLTKHGDDKQVLLPWPPPFIYGYLPRQPRSLRSTRSCPMSRASGSARACPIVPSSSTGERRMAEDSSEPTHGALQLAVVCRLYERAPLLALRASSSTRPRESIPMRRAPAPRQLRIYRGRQSHWVELPLPLVPRPWISAGFHRLSVYRWSVCRLKVRLLPEGPSVIRSSPMSLTALEFSCFNLLGHVRDC
jgi:hypothetical protein